MLEFEGTSPRGLDSPKSENKNAFANSTKGALVDPASFLRIALDPQLKLLTPAHWAYEWIQAVLSGDAEFLDLKVKSAAAKFDVSYLTEPLTGTSGQTMLHVAALMNRPSVLEVLLTAVDRALAVQSNEHKTSVRLESVATKSGDIDPAKQKAELAKELDRIDRLYHIQCEQQFLTLVSTLDSGGRSVLHYAATARGVMVPAVLNYKRDRFKTCSTSEISPPIAPLFPEDGYVSPHTGDLWQPIYYEFPQDHPAQTPPNGYLAIRDLLKARNDPLFIDAKDHNNGTPLHYATVANDVRGIRCLLEFGAELFVATKQGATPLELADNKAVRHALVPMENALQVSLGMKMRRPGVKAPGNSTVDFARTATQTARARAGEAVLDRDNDGATTVAQRRSAAENALVFLVDTGEDINGRTGPKLQAPLHVACEKGNVEVVQLLLTNGAIVDICDVNGCTPLHLVSELGTDSHMAIAQLLFDTGANVNATSSTRKTPLHMAAAGGPYFKPGHRIVPTEKQYDQDGNAIEGTGDPEEPPGGTGDGNSAMITLLTKLGANMEAMDTEGNTPLIAAAKRGNHLGVQTLLTLGARIYASNIHGHTALHTSAFAHQIPVVHQLVRWDAEVGKLKYMLDTSGRSAYDMAADPPTRDALHTLYEACASGQLDLSQNVFRQARLLPATAAAPWLPVRIWETTRLMRRTALHCTITGAAKAMAQFRKDFFDKQSSREPVRGLANAPPKQNKVADALSKAIKQRHDRERNPDPAKGTGLPPHRIAPSAARIVSGVGLRFVPSPRDPFLPYPLQDYLDWGGNHADVILTFPELKDAQAVAQWVDRYAFVPRTGVHTSFIDQALLGDVSRSEAAAKRVVPGNELTSTTTEKDYGRIVDFLVRSGVDMNAGDVDGVTALMMACKFGLLFIIRKLLLRGADAQLADAMGNTAMHYARAFKQVTAADVLAEFTADDSGGSVLDLVPNAEGKTPGEVKGLGISIFPDSAERLVNVPRLAPKSESLHITKAL